MICNAQLLAHEHTQLCKQCISKAKSRAQIPAKLVSGCTGKVVRDFPIKFVKCGEASSAEGGSEYSSVHSDFIQSVIRTIV
jgi:hypothetical protein